MTGDLVADYVLRAERLRLLGVDQFNLGKPSAARRLHRRALRILEDARAKVDEPDHSQLLAAAARAWTSLGVSEVEIRGVDAGLAALARARELCSTVNDPELDALICGNLGYLHLRSGRLNQALTELNAAVAKIAHVPLSDQFRFLNNRGIVNLYLTDLRQAQSDFRRAERLAEDERLQDDRAGPIHNLGYLYYLQGNLPLALAEFARASAADVQHSLGGIGLLDRARVLREAGLVRDADDALAQAAEIFARDQLGQDLAETELARAECAYIAGDLDAARTFATDARRRFRRRGSDRWRLNSDLVLLRIDVARQTASRRTARQAAVLAEELANGGHPGMVRTARLLQAEALLAIGDLPAARQAMHSAGRIGRSDTILTRLHSRLVRAKVHLADGDTRQATRQLRGGLGELASYQAQFGSLDARTAGAVHGRQLAALDLEIAVDSGRPLSVLAAIETQRATSRRLPVPRPPRDEQAAQLSAELRATRERLRELEYDRAHDSETPVLRRKVTGLQQQIRERGWISAGSGDVADTVPPAQILATVAERGVSMVIFAVRRAQLRAIVLRDGTATLTDVLTSYDEVEENARRLRADLDLLAYEKLPLPVVGSARSSLRATLDRLDGALVRGLDTGDSDLVIVPTGVLGSLPWGLMPSLVGRPTVVANSATSWRQGAAIAMGSGAVAAFAGPELPHAGREAAQVAQAWGGGARAHTGDPANRLSLLEALSRCSIVHVAAHGRHQSDNPMFSLLRMNDGDLYAYDLDGIDRVPAHVVLAACELGLASVRPGDEPLGFTSVLLNRGSRSVVSSVARVADGPAAEAMIEYHRRLARGAPAPVALAETIAHARHEAPLPFVCFGA